MKRYVCIHGHFYQPPRENPWLEEIESQESAYPYHDWNQRVNAECYAPNTASRIMGPDRRIIKIVNNYSMISFDFGPTLLSWMERHAPETYEAILEADSKSIKEFSGHGSAMALPYNHVIMPLSSERDKMTQTRWGIEDFKARFRREPEGMWLPETAVDNPTLEVIADAGIRFTVLAPHQAARFRKIGDRDWTLVGPGGIPTERAYLYRLPSGRSVSIFFYNEEVSKEVAFGRLLENGEAFAKRILGCFKDEGMEQIVSVATDGETYGHHRKFGEMALSYCIHYIRSNGSARMTNYGEFLERCPPEYEVQILEKTSWSCPHGIQRWMDDCGCSTGTCPLQGWRRPLREAMDWLRDELASTYEATMGEYTEDPWGVRDKYISVVLDRGRENVDSFFNRNFMKALEKAEKVRVLKLLEMERQAMLMQTSCGWFFDDISGIEAIQVMRHAARAIQLHRELTGNDLEGKYLDKLKEAKSNFPKYRDGAKIYETLVKPSVVNLAKVGVHYAISSIFNGEREGIHRVYCYTVEDKTYNRQKLGKNVLVTGSSKITSDVTWEEEEVCYAAFWLGDHNICGGVRRCIDELLLSQIQRELHDALKVGDFQKLIDLIEIHFGRAGTACSLNDLFKDRQVEVIGKILEPSLERARSHFQEIFEDNFAVMSFMRKQSLPIPPALRAAAEVVLTWNMVEALDADDPDAELLNRIAEDALGLQVDLDKELIALHARRCIERGLDGLVKNPDDMGKLQRLEMILRTVERLQLGINFWRAQNLLFSTITRWHGYMKSRDASGDPEARIWLEKVKVLADLLGIEV
ncbi:MAG: DUF3536 domain-containing protein [Candidatus Verstraetearchaeota archaeon]|nr:DUF3536 domain-containing protein [Candidatus Verstraetearchaeota archaeon]